LSDAPVFGGTYASAYDAMYESKDYERECDLVEQAFERFAAGPVHSILDLGCGTGGHALPLAGRGHEVVGVDRSAEMIARAKAKAADAGVSVDFREGDAQDLDLGRSFDAVIVMFAVIGYQLTNDEVRALLATARRHLEPGGVLVFDTWHGPGVIASPPGSGERDLETPGGPMKRIVTGELDVRRHRCTVNYRLIPADGPEERETHVMRFFFPLELELLCQLEGFEMVSITPFGSLDGDVSRDTWNATVVASAR
jgi:SAM-dependent methyltransferase